MNSIKYEEKTMLCGKKGCGNTDIFINSSLSSFHVLNEDRMGKSLFNKYLQFEETGGSVYICGILLHVEGNVSLILSKNY
jgi:hypothetical protein